MLQGQSCGCLCLTPRVIPFPTAAFFFVWVAALIFFCLFQDCERKCGEGSREREVNDDWGARAVGVRGERRTVSGLSGNRPLLNLALCLHPALQRSGLRVRRYIRLYEAAYSEAKEFWPGSRSTRHYPEHTPTFRIRMIPHYVTDVEQGDRTFLLRPCEETDFSRLILCPAFG